MPRVPFSPGVALSEVPSLTRFFQDYISRLDQYDREGLIGLIEQGVNDPESHVSTGKKQFILDNAKSKSLRDLQEYIKNIYLSGMGLGVAASDKTCPTCGKPLGVDPLKGINYCLFCDKPIFDKKQFEEETVASIEKIAESPGVSGTLGDLYASGPGGVVKLNPDVYEKYVGMGVGQYVSEDGYVKVVTPPNTAAEKEQEYLSAAETQLKTKLIKASVKTAQMTGMNVKPLILDYLSTIDEVSDSLLREAQELPTVEYDKIKGKLRILLDFTVEIPTIKRILETGKSTTDSVKTGEDIPNP